MLAELADQPDRGLKVVDVVFLVAEMPSKMFILVTSSTRGVKRRREFGSPRNRIRSVRVSANRMERQRRVPMRDDPSAARFVVYAGSQ